MRTEPKTVEVVHPPWIPLEDIKLNHGDSVTYYEGQSPDGVTWNGGYYAITRAPKPTQPPEEIHQCGCDGC